MASRNYSQSIRFCSGVPSITKHGTSPAFALVRLRLDYMQNEYCLHTLLNTCGKGFSLMHLGPGFVKGRAALGSRCVLHTCSPVVAKEKLWCGSGARRGGHPWVWGLRRRRRRGCKKRRCGANALVCKSVDEQYVSVVGVPEGGRWQRYLVLVVPLQPGQWLTWHLGFRQCVKERKLVLVLIKSSSMRPSFSRRVQVVVAARFRLGVR